MGSSCFRFCLGNYPASGSPVRRLSELLRARCSKSTSERSDIITNSPRWALLIAMDSGVGWRAKLAWNGGDAAGLRRGAGRRSSWPGRVLLWVVWVGLAACSSSDPGTDSTTHFWERCTSDAACDTGGQCVCGRCSFACDSDESCHAVDAQCVRAALRLDCDFELNICAPTRGVVRDASAGDAAEVNSPTETEPGSTQSSIVSSSSTVAPAASDSGEPPSDVDASSSLAPSATSASGESTATAAGPDSSSAVTSAVSDVVESNDTQADDSQSDDGTVETLSPVATPLEKYATSGESWKFWRGDRMQAATGCELVASASDVETCGYAWECVENAYTVACREFGVGFWDCSCLHPEMVSFNARAMFSAQTYDSAAACEATFRACTTPPAELDCALTFLPGETAGDACRWQQRCTVTDDETGAVASDGAQFGSCSADEGFSLCRCNSPNWSRTYLLEDVAGEDACKTAQVACHTSPDPLTWQRLDCVDAVGAEGELCAASRSCPLVGELPSPVSAPSQVTALSQLHVSSHCELEQDALRCSCEGESGQISWAATRPGTTAQCLMGLDLCERSQALEITGSPGCRSTSGVDQLSSCSRKERCTTSATWEGQQLILQEDIDVFCQRSTDEEEWSCLCDAGGTQESARFDPSLTQAQACNQHLSDCRELVEFSLEPTYVP